MRRTGRRCVKSGWRMLACGVSATHEARATACVARGYSRPMPSWRDTASPQCQADLDGPLGHTLGFAQQTLERYGQLSPFGVAVGADGQTRMLASDPGSNPTSQQVLDLLIDGARSDKETLRAVAIVADVRLSDGDAVQVELEHREGSTMMVLLPYRPATPPAGIQFEPLRAGAGKRRIWR